MRANKETDNRVRKWSERDKMVARMLAKDPNVTKTEYYKTLGASRDNAEALLEDLGVKWVSKRAKRSSS